jgi:cell division protein FtsA
MSDELIYALDVGTRKVMGLIAKRSAAGVEVLACDVAEHPTRSMSAGEVRDVRAVGGLIRAQVERLSAVVGHPIKRAAVAVAGRDLRTNAGRALLSLPHPGPVEPDHVRLAVHEAVQNALSRLPRGEGGLSSHSCVGYAATRFLIDGDAVADPIGHHASRLEVEVLATTLPRRVLDGLTAALEHAGLEASTITLEPIAALQAAVPEDLRRFHLALVDVGAGTSDIAIVRDGEIRAFGMVPCAGDFVTETLADLAALDFFTAERAKRELSAGRETRVPDVFDNMRVLTPAETLPLLQPAVRELAAHVAASIRALGSGTPRLVLCVGGGSLTPGLQEEIAAALALPSDRVGRRRATAQGLPESVSGPQAATPLGIALIAAAERGLRLRRVRLDGRGFHALEIGRPLTVRDALVAAGVPARDVHGRLGLSITYTLNGELKTVRGTCGKPGRVSCGGIKLSLDAPLPQDADLSFTPAEPGEDARPTLGRALASSGLERRVHVLGKTLTLHPQATVNGAPADPDAPLADRARVEWRRWPDLGEILAWAGAPAGARPMVDGAPADRNAVPRDGAVVEFSPVPENETAAVEFAPEPKIETAAAPPARRATLTVLVNGDPVVLERPQARGFGAEGPVLLVDLLPRLGAALLPVAGRRLRLMIDGSPAGYTTPLHEGAEVAIRFD